MDMVPVQMRHANVEALRRRLGGSAAAGHHMGAEVPQAAAGIQDETAVAVPNLDARRVAAVRAPHRERQRFVRKGPHLFVRGKTPALRQFERRVNLPRNGGRGQ